MSTTPRTDARELAISIQNEDSCCAIYVKIDGKEYEGGLVDSDFARKLECENAALRAIIDATLRALPVCNVRTHTPDSIAERVADSVKAHADELADNEQLRKDKARLDWLLCEGTREIITPTTRAKKIVLAYVKDEAESYRAAIDAAMEAGI
jgi:hypothetical protein